MTDGGFVEAMEARDREARAASYIRKVERRRRHKRENLEAFLGFLSGCCAIAVWVAMLLLMAGWLCGY